MPVAGAVYDGFLRVRAQRALHSDAVFERVVVPLRRYEVLWCGTVLDPLHHGEQDVVLRVNVAGNAEAIAVGRLYDLAGCCDVVGRDVGLTTLWF